MFCASRGTACRSSVRISAAPAEVRRIVDLPAGQPAPYAGERQAGERSRVEVVPHQRCGTRTPVVGIARYPPRPRSRPRPGGNRRSAAHSSSAGPAHFRATRRGQVPVTTVDLLGEPAVDAAQAAPSSSMVPGRYEECLGRLFGDVQRVTWMVDGVLDDVAEVYTVWFGAAGSLHVPGSMTSTRPSCPSRSHGCTW